MYLLKEKSVNIADIPRINFQRFFKNLLQSRMYRKYFFKVYDLCLPLSNQYEFIFCIKSLITFKIQNETSRIIPIHLEFLRFRLKTKMTIT